MESSSAGFVRKSEKINIRCILGARKAMRSAGGQTTPPEGVGCGLVVVVLPIPTCFL